MNWLALLALTGLFAGLGMALPWLARRPVAAQADLATTLDALLPQTQCGQCDYAGCRPYAEALAAGTAPPNRCVPGGTRTRDQLLERLELWHLAEAYPAPRRPEPPLARIDEARCVACTLCLDACPVDAIVGARGLAHTVLTDECTGCALCLPVCPVDCIELDPVPPAAWLWQAPTPLRPEHLPRGHH